MAHTTSLLDRSSSAESLQRSSSIPDEFLCPITGELFRSPVTLTSGKTYERAAILEWFEYGHTTCPLTRQKIDGDLVVNTELQQKIKAWHAKLSQQGLENIPLVSSSPMQAFSGHFLLPAVETRPPGPATITELVREVRNSQNPQYQEHLLRQLLMAAAECEAKRDEIASNGAVPHLVRFVLTGTDGMRWQSAEVLSYLSLDTCARVAILSCVHQQLRTHGFDVDSEQPEETVRIVSAELDSKNGGKNVQKRAIAIWSLWCLSLWDYLRGLMATRGVMNGLVKSLSMANESVIRVGAARVVRSLAMVNKSLALMEEVHMVPALVFLLQGGGKLERVAGCTALCNLALCPQFEHMDDVLYSDMVLEPLLELLQGTCLPQQRSAARMLKALASGKQRSRIIDWLLSSGAVAALVNLLDHEDRLVLESVVASVLTLVDGACEKTRLAMVHSTPVLSHLVGLLRHSSNSISFTAVKTLAVLSQLSDAATFCAQTAMFRPVLEMLQMPDEHRQYQAARVLLNVCDNEDALHLLLLDDPAPLRALVQLLASNYSDYQAAAARLIQRVATLEVNRPYVAKVGGVHALLEVLKGGIREHTTVSAATAALESLARADSYWRQEILGACQEGDSLPPNLPDILFAA